MKNMRRILGVIATVAVIGLVAGCLTEADPEDQVIISFTGFPSKANNNYFVRMYLSEEKVSNVKILANGGEKAERIRSNTGTNAMLIVDGSDKGKAFGKAGSYYVNLSIFSGSDDITGTPVFSDWTTNKLAIGKGRNSFELLDIQVGFGDVVDYFDFVDAPDDDFFGTYTGAGFGTATETISFTNETFRISDNSGDGGKENFLAFTIQKWDNAEVPAEFKTAYPIGYKFTGIITDGFQINNTSTAGFIYGDQTAPGFTQSDITNKTLCHMYIYTNGTGSSFTFVRSVFSKEGGTDKKDVVKTSTAATGTARVYTKKP